MGKRVSGGTSSSTCSTTASTPATTSHGGHGDGAAARAQARPWERGYGDMKLVPDSRTWRPALAARRRRWSSATSTPRRASPIEEAPRWMLRRQIERAAEHRLPGDGGSELELLPLQGVLSTRRAPSATAASTPGVATTSRTTTSCRPPRRSRWSAPIRNQMEARRGAGGVLQGRVGAGPGGDQPALRRGPRDGRPPRALQARREGDRRAAGRVASPSWRSTTRAPPARAATCTVSLWDPHGREERSSPRSGSRAGDAALPHGWPARWRWRGSSPSSTRRRSTPTSATSRATSRRPRIACGLGQPHLRLPPLRRGRRLRVENRIPGADANPYLAFAATIAAGLHGIDAEARAAAALRGQCLRGRRRSRRSRRRCARRSPRSESRVARAAFGDRWSSTTCTTAGSSRQAFDQAVTDWELDAPLRADLSQDAEKGPRFGVGSTLNVETRLACALTSIGPAPLIAGTTGRAEVAFITGAGMGMGREAAMLFAEEGASIVVADIDAPAAEETVDLVEGAAARRWPRRGTWRRGRRAAHGRGGRAAVRRAARALQQRRRALEGPRPLGAGDRRRPVGPRAWPST